VFGQLRRILRVSRAHHIARRYFIVNGFDGALAMLGLNVGFLMSEGVSISTAISACTGTAIALSVSGLSSGYVSEAAERRKELHELERAMVTDLDASVHGTAARYVPWLISLVNGMAPLLIAMVIITPLWLHHSGVGWPFPPIESAIGAAFLAVFLLGILLGRISGTFWLWAGIRTLLIALLTSIVIIVVDVA
jgi:predicted membrane protein (TIGR00267 family)